MPVRVLHTSELFHHPLPGGMMQCYRFAPGLIRRGIDMQMITLATRSGLAEREDMNGIKVERLEPPSRPDQGALIETHRQRRWLLSQALKRCHQSPNVPQVLQPNALSWLMWPQLLAARRHGIPVVHLATIAPEHELPSKTLAAIKHKVSMKLTFGLVSRVIMLSSQMKRTCQQHYHLREKQTTIITNGVDLQHFKPSPDASYRALLREQLQIPNDARVVLFVGGVMPRKGVDLLLSAWNNISSQDAKALLLVVGSNGPRDSHQSNALSIELQIYAKTLADLLAGLRHPSSVRFVGEVADPAPYFQAADVFAFPSHREGLPTALLEAMSAGLPVVTSPFVGLPAPGEEIGHPGEHFLLLQRDADLWSRILVELLSPSTADRRAQMGQAARSWVSKTNDLERTLDLWSGLYHSLASRV